METRSNFQILDINSVDILLYLREYSRKKYQFDGIFWEKGTDRAAFFLGEVHKYGWVDIGSSYLPSELNAAYIWAQLENIDAIQKEEKPFGRITFTSFPIPG